MGAARSKGILTVFFFFQKIGQNGALSGNGGHHRLRHAKMLRVHGFKPISGVFGFLFSKNRSKRLSRTTGGPQSISFDETSRKVSV